MSESRPLVFAGENPLLMLYRPGAEEHSVVASLWRGTYSAVGVGYVLVIWTDPQASGLGEAAPTGIYTDNADLARLVWENFNQHFGPFQNRGIGASAPIPARFVEEAGGLRFHRIACAAGTTTIDLLWQDVQDIFQNSETASFGGATWHIANVLGPCARASIAVNGAPVVGEVRPSAGTARSSAFLAFCESWVKGA
jgi:hypothetical protein